MKAQHNRHGVAGGPNGRKLKLLLVGRDYEHKNNVARQIFSGERLRIAGRSATLLGALERLQSDTIDLVLLSHEFQEAELALFIADARRVGFAGLILRSASMQGTGPGSSADLRAPTRSTYGISLTARQRAVLTFVSRGWTSQRVAQHLKCSEGAVKATLQQLFGKLGVRKRAQIVRVAFEKDLIRLEKMERAVLSGRAALDRPAGLPAEMPSEEPIRVGDFVVNVSMHRVWIRGVEIHLTPTEFELLTIFATHPGELVRSTTLSQTFWQDSTIKQEALRVLISGLRAKIEQSRTTPRYIVTERNFGYRFIPSPPIIS
jgi:DNA-binding response OmpR family regulator